MTTDVWMQHPTLRFMQDDMFESLRRWTGQQVANEELPLEMTLAMMDEGGVERGFVCAWYGPGGSLISNDEVGQWAAQHPDRFTPVRLAVLPLLVTVALGVLALVLLFRWVSG